MNNSDGHQHQLFASSTAELNGIPPSLEAENKELETMGIQTDLRAGSPCRQAATDLMEDMSMDSGMNDEAFRRDMFNVFPGHPALPQQTPTLSGDGSVDNMNGRSKSGLPLVGNFGGGGNMFNFGPSIDLPEDQPMMGTNSLASEPDWITQMLEQVQKVGLWNEPIPEEPARAADPPELTSSFSSVQPAIKLEVLDPIPFYKQEMESLLMNLPSASSELTQMPIPMPESRNMEVAMPRQQENPARVPGNTAGMPSQAQPMQIQPSCFQGVEANRTFSLPTGESGMGVIGSKQSTQSVDYLNLLRNALTIPGMSNLLQMQPSRGVSLELSQDGMKEVLESSMKTGMNDGPFRPPTREPPRSHLMGRRSLDSARSNSVLQQSQLQLKLGLAADSPIDLRRWEYGDDPALPSAGKRSLSSEAMHAVGSSAEMAHSQRIQGKPEASGCSAESIPSAAGPSQMHQQSLNSGSIDRAPQASDRKSGLSADEVTRLESLERYREKKRRRLYTKTIRYHKRKVNADARKRYKGRFVKAESAQHEADQLTDPGNVGNFEQSMEVSDLRTV